MKLFLIRYTKLIFTYLHLNKFFGLFAGFYANLLYQTRFSSWANKHRKIAYNDFPSKWDYNKRFGLYEWVIDREQLDINPITYLEFGVAQGYSFKWFLEKNKHVDSRFYGFDTFTGLPEDWGPFKKGYFNNESKPPEIDDSRGSFFQGLFQQTLPGFLPQLAPAQRKVIMLDADLYSATLFVLTTLAPHLRAGDIIFFDEFAVPTHEFKAYYDFVQSYYMDLEVIGAANNYYFTAFRVR